MISDGGVSGRDASESKRVRSNKNFIAFEVLVICAPVPTRLFAFLLV